MEAIYQPIVRKFFAAMAFALTFIAFIIVPLFFGGYSTPWPLDPVLGRGVTITVSFSIWFCAGVVGKAFMAGEARFLDDETSFEYASVGLSVVSLLAWIALCFLCFSTKFNPFSASHLPFVEEAFLVLSAFSMPAVDAYNISYWFKDFFTARLSASA